MTGGGGPPLPYGDPRHQAAAQFLVEEAHLLDRGDFEGWLGLLHPEIHYRMPVRVTSVKAAAETDVQTMDHFDEDWYSLSKRVQRFQTDSAWTEDPQSRIRHHVSNVRTFTGNDGSGQRSEHGSGGELVVESAVLLYRSRGDRTAPSVLSAGRTDVLVPAPDGSDHAAGLRLRSRHIDIDEAVLRTQNLAIFL